MCTALEDVVKGAKLVSQSSTTSTEKSNTTVDKGDAGYDKGLKARHIQMIAIGGSIGTGLFLGAGGRLAQGGAGLVFAYAVCGIFAFLMVRALGELAISPTIIRSFRLLFARILGRKGCVHYRLDVLPRLGDHGDGRYYSCCSLFALLEAI